ncbi:hypothetical protein PQ465_05730 [Sphingobacterium oryzagri]|uniref:TonB-dependent receptor plug domain-containing protein n=1 Tax=Sphingobacterium oryzagri TaxID=3025669 RepID=A0ABY7WK41_9SPHI|nr:hypothetical protein [Sphingobacterium sp. KACC 22765]WDF69875.1 hypothetical protein PQ465_05730 [Sphingobacterium sp. KACC 22765]
MKFVLLAIFLICCCGYAYAQKVTFSVIDSVNHTPVNDALIYFYTNLIPDNSMRLGTDSQGKVSVQLIRPGIIDTVVVEAYPYQRAAMQHINVINDTIISVYLNRATIDLEEVQVGFRGGARLANNKIIYHPYPSAFNKTRSVTELLPLIPNMAVRNGKFFFRNDGNFVILIDGMGENKTKEEQLSILQNMPVDAIHQVEIIDNPSARYGDGTVAVVNFLTKKDVAYTSVRGSVSSQIFHDGDLQDYPSAFDIAADARFRLGKNNLHFIARLGDHRALTAINTDQAYLLNYLRQTERMIKHDKSNQFSFVWDRKLSEHFTAQVNTSYTHSNTLNRGTSAVNALQSTNESNFVTHNSEHMKNSRFTFTPQFKLSLNKANGTTIYMNPTYASLTFLKITAMLRKIIR